MNFIRRANRKESKFMNTTAKFFREFASDWQNGWNSHDLDVIMKHYRSDVVFRSRKAMRLMGTGEIVGLDNLKLYWSEALKRQPNLHFTVINVFEGYKMMVISYKNHSDILAAETLYFDENGHVFQAAACHCDP